jgi:PmbA protein
MKQYYKIHSKETTVRVLNTEVSAVRKKDIVRKAVRVIEDGFIGIAGSIGNRDDQALELEAKENLAIQIPYPYESNEPSKAGVVINDNNITHDNVLETVEEVLEFLKTYDEFDFSEVAKVTEETVTFKDSEGTDLLYKDMHLDMGFILKDKALANLFDGFVGYSGRNFDINKFKTFNSQMLDAYKIKLDMPEEDELPVMIIDDSIFHMKLMTELNGEKLGAGASLLSGKYDEKLFNDKITIVQDFNPQTAYRAFFDMEGTVNKNYEYTFIDNGVLKSGFTNKKVATDYDIKHTGSATGAFDDVPALGMTKLAVKVDSENIKDIKKAIMVIIAAGGDYTSDGTYATPVQKAFLYENGDIKGTLPEFQLRSHLFTMLGEDYIGTYESPFYFDDSGKVTVCKMKIEK